MDPGLQPLSLRQKLAFVAEAMASYVPARRILRHRDVAEMVRMARDVRQSIPRPAGPEEHLVALRLGRVVGRTLRLLPTDSRCLIQCLVLSRMLARRGIPGTLVVGVRSTPSFGAHAWVEHEGRPVLPAGEYTRLIEL